MSSSYDGAHPICVFGVTKQLTGNEWHKHLIVTGPEVLCLLGIDCFRKRVFQGPNRVLVGFWYSCLEDGGNGTVVLLAWPLEGPVCDGFAEV